MDDRSAALRRTRDVIEIQQVHAIRAVEAGHVVAETREMTSYWGADAVGAPWREAARSAVLEQGSL